MSEASDDSVPQKTTRFSVANVPKSESEDPKDEPPDIDDSHEEDELLNNHNNGNLPHIHFTEETNGRPPGHRRLNQMKDEDPDHLTLSHPGTLYLKSLRHYLTREALPHEQHYRNILSLGEDTDGRKYSRPTLEELHQKSEINDSKGPSGRVSISFQSSSTNLIHEADHSHYFHKGFLYLCSSPLFQNSSSNH